MGEEEGERIGRVLRRDVWRDARHLCGGGRHLRRRQALVGAQAHPHYIPIDVEAEA